MGPTGTHEDSLGPSRTKIKIPQSPTPNLKGKDAFHSVPHISRPPAQNLPRQLRNGPDQIQPYSGMARIDAPKSGPFRSTPEYSGPKSKFPNHAPPKKASKGKDDFH